MKSSYLNYLKIILIDDREKLCHENIKRAEQRWTQRKSHINQSNNEPIKFRKQGICYAML